MPHITRKGVGDGKKLLIRTPDSFYCFTPLHHSNRVLPHPRLFRFLTIEPRAETHVLTAADSSIHCHSLLHSRLSLALPLAFPHHDASTHQCHLQKIHLLNRKFSSSQRPLTLDFITSFSILPSSVLSVSPNHLRTRDNQLCSAVLSPFSY